MNKLLRAGLALASFALVSALFGSEIDLYVADGQRLEFQIAGTTGAEFWVTKLGPGGGSVAYISAAHLGDGWSSSYNWSGGVYQSGSVTFATNNPFYSATLFGLSEGTYRISAYGQGSSYEYYRSQSGSTAYISQGDSYSNQWVDFSFEAW